MFQAIATRQRSLSRQLEDIQERNRWRRLKGQENLAHTLCVVSHSNTENVLMAAHYARLNKKGKGHG